MVRKIAYIFLSVLITSCSNSNKQKTPYTIAEEWLAENYDGEVELVLDSKNPKITSVEGFCISRLEEDGHIVITSPSEAGVLYGAGRLMSIHALGADTAGLYTVENPAYDLRILNHWDNLDGTVERGYAGRSIWKWAELPDTLSPLYDEYAMRCASVGINGTVLNNVNASPEILTSEYLAKVKSIADCLRQYGIRTYLAVNFASPMALDSLPTADPLDPSVIDWWNNKANEIYTQIPDFGGFLVKANSEGQPGPCDFGRTHAEGANMLAKALDPHGGIVMWRAFVYSPTDADRAKQAYLEFQPLDGKFDSNVILQIKNGPIDFQPREPYSPLFGSMPGTPQMVEFQITQEYLGHSNHLAYLAPMWNEFFDYVDPESLTAIAGVANVGDSPGLTGHPFADANWYAFGRLTWNPNLSAAQIADEWLSMRILSPETPDSVRETVRSMMLDSREAVVDYMMPLGLHHIFAWGHHYGPEPWCDIPGARADWLPKYYHRADARGIGFDRTTKGSNAVSQYPKTLAKEFDNIDKCPEQFLLWFHHVPWTHKMKSGKTLWQEMCASYQRGVDKADSFETIWTDARPYIQPDTYNEVLRKLKIQKKDARWWRDACLQYFAQYSGMALPSEISGAAPLDSLMRVRLPITNYECPSETQLDLAR